MLWPPIIGTIEFRLISGHAGRSAMEAIPARDSDICRGALEVLVTLPPEAMSTVELGVSK